jgi:hypothetical protein
VNVSFKLIALLLTTAPLVCAAQNQSENQTKLSCVKDITFHQEFIKSYPGVAAACKEVSLKDGQKWVRFDAKIRSLSKDQLTADFTNAMDSTVQTVVFKPKPDARLTVNGSEAKLSSLKSGDTLSVWMPESRIGFYGQPGPQDSDKLVVVSASTPHRE